MKVTSLMDLRMATLAVFQTPTAKISITHKRAEITC